jgi:enediyne biosynthesis protein E4
MRDDLLQTLPMLASRFRTYQDYAKATAAQLFSTSELAGAITKSAETFATTLVRNDGGGKFTLLPLPREAQLAPVYGILPQDVDSDGITDLIIAGNFEEMKLDFGAMHASYGLVLRGDGRGAFVSLPSVTSGFFAPGSSRDVQRVRTRAGDLYVVARNNDRPLFFKETLTRANVTRP